MRLSRVLASSRSETRLAGAGTGRGRHYDAGKMLTLYLRQ